MTIGNSPNRDPFYWTFFESDFLCLDQKVVYNLNVCEETIQWVVLSQSEVTDNQNQIDYLSAVFNNLYPVLTKERLLKTAVNRIVQ